MTLPPEGQELYRRVQEAAQGTPYLVEETEHGFDVTLDIVDAQWFGIFNKAGLQKVFIHHVTFPAPGVYTIADDSRTVDWVAGVPELKVSVERQYGRVVQIGAKKVWAFDERGRFGVQADYQFNSEEGRDLITGVASQLPLTQRRGAAERTGLIFAAIAIGGLAIGAIIVLVLWLATDYFG